MAIIILVGTEEDLRRGTGERALITSEAQAVLKVGGRLFREMTQRGDLVPCDEQLGNYCLYLAKDVERLRQQRMKRY